MTSPTTEETITSADGRQIANEPVGSGPPLVHGGGTRPSLIEEHFTVYAFDRSHSRGERGDIDEYALERQCEDVAAIVDSIDEPVFLYGHSIGAVRSVEAAVRTDNLRRLILYEPSLLFSNHHPYTGDLLAEMTALCDDGENEQALVLLLREATGLTSAEIDALRSRWDWQDSADTLPTLLHDVQAQTEYEFDAARFDEMNIPTLLMVGSESPQWLNDATDAIDDALSNSRIAILEGQGHFATEIAPELVIEEVLAFIRESKL